MTKILSLILIFSLSSAMAAHIPERKHEKVQALAEARLFWIKKSWQYLTELKFSEWEESQAFQSVRLGARKGFSRHLKFGLFYQRSYGLRHDQDWIKDSSWHWRDRKTQGQDSWIGDLTYKNFINDKSTYELRLTYEKNTTVGRSFLKPRIGASYFFSKGHLTLIEELSLPMETRVSSIQEYWTYLTYSYHYNSNASFGPLIAYRTVNWETSQDFERVHQTTYSFKENIWYAGINFAYHFGD